MCIRDRCKGLLPDDDRYSCLIHEMNKVSSDEERINSYGKEYFFNLGDRFERKDVYKRQVATVCALRGYMYGV